MLCHFSWGSRDEILTAFIHQPVQDAEHEENCHGQHLVDVETVPEDNAEQQELKYFFLALFKNVLLLNDSNVSEKHTDEQVGKLNDDHDYQVKED